MRKLMRKLKMRNLKREKVEMIRFSAATIFLVALSGPFMFAQDSVPKVQVFAGYSWMHTGTGGLTGPTLGIDLHEYPGTLGTGPNFNGWNAEAQYNFDRWIGIVADVSGQYGTPITANASGVSGAPNMSEYSFLAGPVLSYRAKKKITPYVHALFGWDRASMSASTFTGTSSPLSALANTYTSFAMVGGAGVDYKLWRHFALRLGQVDYFHTTLDLNSLYSGAFSSGTFYRIPTHENNLRLSTGIVLVF